MVQQHLSLALCKYLLRLDFILPRSREHDKRDYKTPLLSCKRLRVNWLRAVPVPFSSVPCVQTLVMYLPSHMQREKVLAYRCFQDTKARGLAVSCQYSALLAKHLLTSCDVPLQDSRRNNAH